MDLFFSHYQFTKCWFFSLVTQKSFFSRIISVPSFSREPSLFLIILIQETMHLCLHWCLSSVGHRIPLGHRSTSEAPQSCLIISCFSKNVHSPLPFILCISVLLTCVLSRFWQLWIFTWLPNWPDLPPLSEEFKNQALLLLHHSCFIRYF